MWMGPGLCLLTRGLGLRVLRAGITQDKPQTRRCVSKHRLKHSLRNLPSTHSPLSLVKPPANFIKLSSFEIARRLQAEEEEHERRRVEAEERRQRQERKPVYAPEYQQQQQVPTRQMENMRISQQHVTADQLAGVSKKAKGKDKDCVIM